MNTFRSIIFFLIFSYFTSVSRSEVFIVRVQNDLKPSQTTNLHEWYSSTLSSLSASNASLQYTYNQVFHGFSADLTPQQAENLRRRPEIVSVFPDRTLNLLTTRSPRFLGLEAKTASLVKTSDSGANVIIGVVDSGIWPEHPSFDDKGLGPIPSRWKGKCIPGGKENAKKFCNKKLIGARHFLRASRWWAVNTARDDVGHGTHTASTVAGRRVVNASFHGYASGVASGIAPKARIAAYKVCGSGGGCMLSDVIAGIEQAVSDGVDIISMSLGGDPSENYAKDPLAIATFAATEKGVLVSAAGGNNGPGEGTVTNVAPWIATVGASTIDRGFGGDVVLSTGRVIKGASLYLGGKNHKKPETKDAPLVYSGSYCLALGRRARVDIILKGSIVVCHTLRTLNPADFAKIKKLGVVGLVGIDRSDLMLKKPYLIPAVSVTPSDGKKLRAYIETSTNSTKNLQASLRFHGTVTSVKPSPIVADFSSRGPSNTPFILKPDLIAPGVNILAAFPISKNKDASIFRIMSGTSMSCPHVTGIAALLKGVNPSWTPAMIKSAMMTTAYSTYPNGKPILNASRKPATPWAIGAGHVTPEKALDPGLVYNINGDDYVDFLCASNFSDIQIMIITKRIVICKTRKATNPWDINYPAISPVFDLQRWNKSETLVVRRSVTNVDKGSSVYIVHDVTTPKGVTVEVSPRKLKFKKKGEVKSYVVKLRPNKKEKEEPKHDEVAFGELVWDDGKHKVASPISVKYKR